MEQVVRLLAEYGVLVVFFNTLISQAGVPLPAIPTLIVAGALYAHNGLELVEVIAAAASGSMIADTGWFAASRRFGRRVLGLLCRVSLSPDSCVRQTEQAFARFGAFSLLFAKFVPGLGLVSIALSGITGVSVLRFLVLGAMGATIYMSSAVVAGILFQTEVHEALRGLSNLGAVGLAVVAVALAIYLAIRWWRRQAFIRQLRMDRISVPELLVLIDSGDAPLILDVRPQTVRLSEGTIPGALGAHAADDFQASSYPLDREIVIYCSCPNEASAAVAANHLKRAGFRKIRPLLGGTQAWTDSGRPLEFVVVTKSPAELSLEEMFPSCPEQAA
jgi:membrane protein DedA with SNARE-associated domain/rhodanese-related sulfurtransferase